MAFIAPKIIGGKTARTPVEGDGIEQMADAITLENSVVLPVGDDVLISGLVQKNKECSQE